MAKYSVLIKPSAVKEIERIPKKDRQRIAERISSLGDTPRPSGCEKLFAQDKYRVRQGDYRILYSADDNELVVRVFKVGHRRGVYR